MGVYRCFFLKVPALLRGSDGKAYCRAGTLFPIVFLASMVVHSITIVKAVFFLLFLCQKCCFQPPRNGLPQNGRVYCRGVLTHCGSRQSSLP